MTRPLIVALTAVTCFMSLAEFGRTQELRYVHFSMDEETRAPLNLQSYQYRRRGAYPRVLISAGEAYLNGAGGDVIAEIPSDATQLEVRIVGIFAQSDPEETRDVRFTIPKEKMYPSQRRQFLEAKRAHYQQLQTMDLAGRAWFRHRVRELNALLDENPDDVAARHVTLRNELPQTRALLNTFSLITGGRAIAENLQLDREMPEAAQLESTVPVDSIPGIRVREYDWSQQIHSPAPELDPLARMIPADQHVLLCPSLGALANLLDEAYETGTPFLHTAEPKSQDFHTRQLYERQLGFALDDMARLIGNLAVGDVAVTGSDPYYRIGTDLAVLMATTQPQALAQLMQAKLTAQNALAGSAQRLVGKLEGGTPYFGYMSVDRRVSSFVITLDSAVAISNSLAQLQRLEDALRGETDPLSESLDYQFFRQRYPRETAAETALLVITDATIRRWCGPEWRIAQSRRLRAAAVLAEVQAENLASFVRKEMPNDKVTEADFSVSDAEQFVSSSQGMRSDRYGDMRFQTPIIEMNLTNVTPEERQFYERWRDGYERRWSGYFDPIAVQLRLSPSQFAGDVTVRPMIGSSEYRTWQSISQGGSLTPKSGDPHAESLLQFVLALDPQSQFLRSQLDSARSFIPLKVHPLEWMGADVAMYVDRDPLLEQLQSPRSDDEIQEFFREHLDQIPVAVRFDVKSGFQLALFLTALRSYIDSTAPGMITWQTHDYADQQYIRIAPADEASGPAGNFLEKAQILYYIDGQSLTVTPSESLIKRAIDRSLAGKKQQDKPSPADVVESPADESPAGTDEQNGQPNNSEPWLGQHIGVRVDAAGATAFSQLFSPRYQLYMQRVAWSNLPILNEWKSLFPDEDPQAIHEKYWGSELVCPGGGVYRWNEKYQTYESTIYGHPGDPKFGPTLPTALQGFSEADFGITFEEDGLRTRFQLWRTKKGKMPIFRANGEK